MACFPEKRPGVYLASLIESCIQKRCHLSGRIIHSFILRAGIFFVDTFLCNRLIEFYSQCGRLTSARRVFDKMTHTDIYSANALLSAFCKSGDLRQSIDMFHNMPDRNEVSWNNMITALAKCGQQRDALDAYLTMMDQGFVPTRFTLATVFSACGVLGDSEFGSECHCLAIKVGLDMNVYVGNALLCMYLKCRYFGDALKVFEYLPDRNEVTLTALMSGLAEAGWVKQAFDTFRWMHKSGFQIDSVMLSSVLGLCSRRDSIPFEMNDVGKLLWFTTQIHCLVTKLGYEQELHLSNTLLDCYAKNGDMDSAETIFSNSLKISIVSWNVMIAGYGLKGQSKKSLEYMLRMQADGFQPDEVTYINMLGACINCGDIETGRKIFDSIPCPSLSSWNAMLSGYSQSENHKDALKLFREMQFRGIPPDKTTNSIVLSSCSGLGFLESGKQVHASSLRSGIHDDIYIGSGLIGMYSKCGKTDLAKSIFDQMRDVDVVCWNAMMASLSLESKDKEAFFMFKQMRQRNTFPSHFSFATVLNCCSNLSSLLQGIQVHAQIIKDGHLNDVFVGSALIDMYCKSGELDCARSIFDRLSDKNTVSWNEMIHGYAQNGHGDKAVSLYESMVQSDEKPDAITFVSVLTACSHSGLVDKGIQLFNEMQTKFGIDPLMDHYTCMIDLLGRAGLFQEAEMLLNELPNKDDPMVWEVLLSSCRFHGNVTLARRASEELFRLAPENSSPYSLLANMYTSLGRWDDVEATRGLMIQGQVVKRPGISIA
uniref:Pentatricopeptide repeat-containing protein n=1 Tax=Kalanchoe fedtschenkoi TaxID=63787 RepID=A0A7N0VH76_KALFE